MDANSLHLNVRVTIGGKDITPWLSFRCWLLGRIARLLRVPISVKAD